jgi:hypothetical protein
VSLVRSLQGTGILICCSASMAFYDTLGTGIMMLYLFAVKKIMRRVRSRKMVVSEADAKAARLFEKQETEKAWRQ